MQRVMGCDGQSKKTQGPFGPTCEAPHTYLTGTSQQVEHSKQRILEGRELDTSFLEKLKENSRRLRNLQLE